MMARKSGPGPSSRRALGKLSAAKGQRNEDRVLEACVKLVDEDPRFHLARAATDEEQGEGVDVSNGRSDSTSTWILPSL